MSASVPQPAEFLGVNLLAGLTPPPVDNRRALEVRLEGAQEPVYVLHDGDPWNPPTVYRLGMSFFEFGDGWCIGKEALARAMVREVPVEDAKKALGDQAAPPEPVPVVLAGAAPAEPADPFDGVDYALWPLEKLEAEEKIERARCDPNGYGNTTTDLLEIRAAIEKKRAAVPRP